jgi:uncharacterized protein (DUF305 family)
VTLSSRSLAALAALLLTVSSCSGVKAPQQADNRNASVQSQTNASWPEAAQISPFEELASIQTETEDAMGAAKGRDISDAWARKMIEHQKGAIRFGELLLKRSPNSAVRTIASSTIVQARQNLRALGSATETSVFGDERFDEQFAKPQLEIFEAMTIPEGKTFEDIWIAKLIAFERGAVNLAGIAINQGDTERAKELARQLAAQQANSAEILKWILVK